MCKMDATQKAQMKRGSDKKVVSFTIKPLLVVFMTNVLIPYSHYIILGGIASTI